MLPPEVDDFCLTARGVEGVWRARGFRLAGQQNSQNLCS